ncbi:MAG TPA: MlaE family lipid ABC transporter permease subunit [Roseiarcus sp.]|jgi:phospholipid/cholesterol/gamma-HCH transport system permease protein
MTTAPAITSEQTSAGVRLALAGGWTIDAGALLERRASAMIAAAAGAEEATIDLSRVERMDTAGAWVIDRSRESIAARGVAARFVGAHPKHAILLQEARFRPVDTPKPRHGHSVTSLLADIGESVYDAGMDLVGGLSFLGRLVSSAANVLVRPQRWRWTSIIYHLEAFGLRSAPIILLITFLVGAIVAQQGIFQLARFNATPYAVDLIGLLVLRELGVLLTSIMIAGRSGSAITAEIGAMKMREEVDALEVMALDPMEVLILPRIIALVLALPLLTFLADMAALFGGACVAWVYGNIAPPVFIARLHDAIVLSTFESGLIKAPFMALVIGLIASREGFAVAGSAESLGRKVTGSVVKSIFMVIVLDGIFAMFFAAVRF